MNFIGIDLEGVLVPEIWMSLAEKTGISELNLTTKDISDYKELMKKRIEVLTNQNIKADILFDVAKKIEPFEGAKNFLNNLREKYQVVILSDTFFNLSRPIFKKLDNPTVFCHRLIVNDNNMISGFKLCIENHKKLTLKYMNKLNFKTIAIGDSLNDIGMLKEAGTGIFFRSIPSITEKHMNHFSCDDYKTLEKKIEKIFKKESD